jgi:hypothetical protein
MEGVGLEGFASGNARNFTDEIGRVRDISEDHSSDPDPSHQGRE